MNFSDQIEGNTSVHLKEKDQMSLLFYCNQTADEPVRPFNFKLFESSVARRELDAISDWFLSTESQFCHSNAEVDAVCSYFLQFKSLKLIKKKKTPRLSALILNFDWRRRWPRVECKQSLFITDEN